MLAQIHNKDDYYNVRGGKEMSLFKKNKKDKCFKWFFYSGQKYMSLFYVRNYPSDKVCIEKLFFDTMEEYEEIINKMNSGMNYCSGVSGGAGNEIFEINAVHKLKKKYKTETVKQQVFDGYELK